MNRRTIRKRSSWPRNHDGVIAHLEPDILECEVKWALGSITTNKASGGDGIPVELFQILKEISSEYSLEGLMLKLKLQTLATWCEELIHLKRPWCWERLKAGKEGDDRRWDGWIASLTRWTWVWVNFRSWWWTGKPGPLRFMGLQRVRHDCATELNWTERSLQEN